MAVGIKGHSVAVFAGTMEDVSFGGALIRTSRPPPPGTSLDVVVMRDDGPPLSLKASVYRVGPDWVGVAWGPLGDPERAFLAAVLASG